MRSEVAPNARATTVQATPARTGIHTHAATRSWRRARMVNTTATMPTATKPSFFVSAATVIRTTASSR